VNAFLHQLDAEKSIRLVSLATAGRMSLGGKVQGDMQQLLQIALANEINVSELAACWMPTTPELDAKLAFARQAGDEAGHFQLVADRLVSLGFDLSQFTLSDDNALFVYLRGLATTVERVAAGLYALESVAYTVNESFIAFCEHRGDAETVRIYRDFIQPDEQAHHELGKRLVEKYATTAKLQELAKDAVVRVLELAISTRTKASVKLGSSCFPGC
jgi:uncharacterized ferritin-like protein (DUF455 family)